MKVYNGGASFKFKCKELLDCYFNATLKRVNAFLTSDTVLRHPWKMSMLFYNMFLYNPFVFTLFCSFIHPLWSCWVHAVLYYEQSRKPSFILVPSNQSLDSFIFGIAEGLVYLHENTKTRIIRRDIKDSNILLDSSL